MRTADRPRRVFGYARVSSYDQGAHGTSLDAQQEEIRRWAKERGYPEPTLHVEIQSGSGEKASERVHQQRLLAALEGGDLVIVAKQDRWSRDTIHFLSTVDDITRRGGRFVAIAENFDAATPEGRFAMTIMSAVAEQERARIRERTVGNRQRLRRMGLFVEGLPPLGYRRDSATKRLTIDEETAPIVRMMFALCVAGHSTAAIAERLRSEYPGTLAFDASGVGRRLRDRRYLGELSVQGASDRKRPAPEIEWIRSHDALVDLATWRRAQDAIDRRRMGGKPTSGDARNAAFLLRGLAVCGHCGRVLSAHAPMPYETVTHGGWYTCRYRRGVPKCDGPTARHDEADVIASDMMLDRLAELRKELARPSKVPRAAPPPADFDAERTKQAKKRAHVIDLLTDGLLTKDEARAKLRAIEDAVANIERREIEHATRVRVRSPEQQRELLSGVQTISTAWARMRPDAKREVLMMHAARVTISRPKEAQRWTRGAWTLSIVWRDP